MSDTQYTADELRKEAAHVAEIAEIYGMTGLNKISEKLCAGADAMDALAKAEARVKELEELLKECADDLSEWVESHYANTKQHPSELRRYNRDIEPVIKARAALQVKP